MSEERYLIRKGGYYYRPNAQGYTNCIDQAGRFTLEDAISYSHPNGPDGPRDGISYEPAPSLHREPIEADREAAAELMQEFHKSGVEPTTKDWLIAGKDDGHALVQAFMRHRLAFSTPAASDGEGKA